MKDSEIQIKDKNINNINEFSKLKKIKKIKNNENKYYKIHNKKNLKLLLIYFFFFISYSLFIKLISHYFYDNHKRILIHKKKDLKICLCSIGKNENLYIKEFVEHYKKIGYNHIFLYDNNDIDSERLEDKILDEVKKGFVSIINYRGYRGKDQNPQLDAYKDCYQKNNYSCNWLSFFDIDEYLEFKPGGLKIQNFLSQKKFNICQVIKINWLFYVNSNNTLYYENKPLQQRMNKPLFNLTINRHIKSTARGNLSTNYWEKVNNPHTSINNFTTCSTSGKIINSSSPYNFPFEHEFAFLKHYQLKSFEEFCLKIKRGRPIKEYKKYRENMISNLLKANHNNTQKYNIIKRIFNITN